MVEVVKTMGWISLGMGLCCELKASVGRCVHDLAATEFAWLDLSKE